MAECTLLVRGDSVHQSQKKSKLDGEEMDRLSALPDCILLHIMSFLCTYEVVKTCLLSRRWQFLWTNISEIVLVEDFFDRDREFVDRVGKFLLMCGGSQLTKFAVKFEYEKCFASDVNTWLQFSVKNKVKNIVLFCYPTEDFYLLPQILYSHSYLTSLTLGNCRVAPRGDVRWGSLKSLSIDLVQLEESVMEKILSGCTVLEVLHLEYCWGLRYLNINSRSVSTLVIEHWGSWNNGNTDNDFLEISAPYVLNLSIIDSRKGYDFRLKNVSSVVRAKFDFYGEEIKNHAGRFQIVKKLLESLKYVKELELGPWCVEVLYVLEVEGWQFPPSTRSCLTLNAYKNNGSIAGILGILKSSPNLETLTIKGAPSRLKETEPGDLVAAYLQNANLDLVAFHVKTIKITSFTKSFLSVEPMATLVKILLKGATVLEKMVISAEELDTRESAVTLISFPRASTKAVIVFN